MKKLTLPLKLYVANLPPFANNKTSHKWLFLNFWPLKDSLSIWTWVSFGHILRTHLTTNGSTAVHLFVLPWDTFLGFQAKKFSGLLTGKSRSQSHYSLRHKPDRLGCCMHANGVCFPRHTVSLIVMTFNISVHIPSSWFPYSWVRKLNKKKVLQGKHVNWSIVIQLSVIL